MAPGWGSCQLRGSELGSLGSGKGAHTPNYFKFPGQVMLRILRADVLHSCHAIKNGCSNNPVDLTETDPAVPDTVAKVKRSGRSSISKISQNRASARAVTGHGANRTMHPPQLR